MRGITRYSEKVPGSPGNYQWSVKFDFTDGFLGITQFDEDGKVKDRVLLSRNQWRALLAFPPQQRKKVARV